MPAYGALLFGRTQQAVEEGGACTGSIVHTRLLWKASLWSHATWLNPQDTGWHRSMFLNLQSVAIAAGFRARSDQAQQRRRDRRKERTGWSKPWRQKSWNESLPGNGPPGTLVPLARTRNLNGKKLRGTVDAASAADDRDAASAGPSTEEQDVDAASAAADRDAASAGPSTEEQDATSQEVSKDAASAAAVQDEKWRAENKDIWQTISAHRGS